MNNTYITKLKSINYDRSLEAIRRIAWHGYNRIRGTEHVGSFSLDRGDVAIYAIAYILMISARQSICLEDGFEAFCLLHPMTDERTAFIKEQVFPVWTDVAELTGRFTEEELAALILFYDPVEGIRSEGFQVPDGVCRLAADLLEIKPEFYVADFNAGKGNFIRQACVDGLYATYNGLDSKYTNVEIARIRFEILGLSAEIETKDILQVSLDLNKNKYDALFFSYPLGLRQRDPQYRYSETLKTIKSKVPCFEKSGTMDWLFNYIAISSVSHTGKAVCIMSNGSTWNSTEREVRKYFVDMGYIEAVIALPERLFDGFSVPVSLVVLSRDNEKIRMVDARNLYHNGRRINTLEAGDIASILDLTRADAKNSCIVGLDDIKDNNYDLYPTRFLESIVPVKDGVPFESVIRNVTRGAGISASTLDEMVSPTPTESQYLMLKNITDGVIDDELPYLKDIEPRLQRYCLKDHSLIISKNGAPFKVAVAELKPNQRILGNGNLFIIDLNEDEMDPYFLKAYFESPAGMSSLKSISVGTSIPNISLESLRTLIIPKPPIDVQKEFSLKYLAAQDNIKYLQSKVDQAIATKNHLFDEFVEGGE